MLAAFEGKLKPAPLPNTGLLLFESCGLGWLKEKEVIGWLGPGRLEKTLILLLGVCACVPEVLNGNGDAGAPLFANIEPVLAAPKRGLEFCVDACWPPNILLVGVCEFVVAEKPPNGFFRAISSSPSPFLFEASSFVLGACTPLENDANGLLTPAG